jgi:uncharacterized phage-associated protein
MFNNYISSDIIINEKTRKDIAVFEEASNQIDENIRLFLDETISEYIDFSTQELVKKSHTKYGPWDNVYNKGEKRRSGANKIIPFDDIIEMECIQTNGEILQRRKTREAFRIFRKNRQHG